jgi:hypothetical protein
MQLNVWMRNTGQVLGRSLFPLVTCVILGGVVLWGPWVTFALAVGCFAFVSAYA